MEMVRLDTIGKLRDRCYRITVYCPSCNKDSDTDLEQLVRERGAASPIVGMRPIQCPRCGHAKTRTIIHTPDGIEAGRR